MAGFVQRLALVWVITPIAGRGLVFINFHVAAPGQLEVLILRAWNTGEHQQFGVWAAGEMFAMFVPVSDLENPNMLILLICRQPYVLHASRASDAPEAAHERFRASASWLVAKRRGRTNNCLHAKWQQVIIWRKIKMSRQRLSDCCTVRVMVMVMAMVDVMVMLTNQANLLQVSTA